MDFNEQWRTIAIAREKAEGLLTQANTVDLYLAAADAFRTGKEQADGLLTQNPDAKGKFPYEGDFRALEAGVLLCEILSIIQKLKDGSIDKAQAKTDIMPRSVTLLNLRADHGRFFDNTFNSRINQIEKIYQKLLQQGAG
mgnify:CR=1 FL=1